MVAIAMVLAVVALVVLAWHVFVNLPEQDERRMRIAFAMTELEAAAVYVNQLKKRERELRHAQAEWWKINHCMQQLAEAQVELAARRRRVETL